MKKSTKVEAPTKSTEKSMRENFWNAGSSGIDKEARNLSKTNKGQPVELDRQHGAYSYRPDLPVASVREGGKKSIVVGSEIPNKNSYKGYSQSEMPSINSKPKADQSKKVIKTYQDGKLVRKEKQGKDLLGRPVVKRKTYGEGGFKKGVEKKTLTKSGVKTKSNY